MKKRLLIVGCMGLSLSWAGAIHSQVVNNVPPVNWANPQIDAEECKSKVPSVETIRTLPGLDNSAGSCPSRFAWQIFVWAFMPAWEDLALLQKELARDLVRYEKDWSQYQSLDQKKEALANIQKMMKRFQDILTVHSPETFELLNRILARPNLGMLENKPDWEELIENLAKLTLTRWQTWATDDETFPVHPDPKNPPIWPTPNEAQEFHRKIKFSSQQAKSPHHPMNSAKNPCQTEANCPEIVYRNREAFDYIVNNNLWYQQGVAAFFDKKVQFPVKGIEFKTKWMIIDPPNSKKNDDRKRYFTMEQDGITYGLVGIHFSTKHLPNWLWATFEHVDNLGRCDYIGCADFFGFTCNNASKTVVCEGENIVRPKKPLNQYYAEPSQINSHLEKWMNELTLDPRLKNYRLKGIQIDYTDPYGRPIILGNSSIETGFAATSSCMSCHVRASFDKNGQNKLGFGADPLGQSYNGSPQQIWFNPFWTYGNKPELKQADFVWAIPFRACRYFETPKERKKFCDDSQKSSQIPARCCPPKDAS
jgi:hypothetical protein